MVLYFDGDNWTPMESSTNEALYSVCGSGSTFFAVGGLGTVLYYDGAKWSRVNSGTAETLYDVWCHSSSAAFVVGANGTILNCSGGGCNPETTDGTTNHLYAVYHSELGPYAAGADGVVLHKDGTNTWKKVAPVPTLEDINDRSAPVRFCQTLSNTFWVTPKKVPNSFLATRLWSSRLLSRVFDCIM